jgi:LL-diaminopimelate aminotransferase
MRAVYQKRRDMVVAALTEAGLQIEPPLGSIYVWAPTPEGRTSVDFAAELLDQAAVVVAPGTGYGENGEGYIRISLSVPDDRLAEATDRIRERLR